MATSAPAVVTAPGLAAMDAASRASYFNNLPADQRAQQLAAYRAYQSQMNRSYMRNTVRKMAVAPQSSGGALNQIYSPGATLPFTIPSAQNAFCEGFIVRLNLSATLAAGTGATYAATAAGALGLIDNIIVQYNGTQARFRPYILRQLALMQGRYETTYPNAVLIGQHNGSLDSYLASSFPTAAGTAPVVLEFYVPFNMLHPQDARGLLPIMGGETSAQVLITCAPQSLGPDPILNAWSVTAGTGAAVTFANTSTVSVYAVYRDGTSYLSPTLLGLDLSGLGTVQTQIDVPLTGLTAGNVYRQKVSIMDQLQYVILTVVDGQQSNKFATNANITTLEADKDSVGANVFWRFGTGTNLSVQEFFAQVRGFLPGQGYDQDLDEGIVPLVTAPSYMESEAGTLSGTHYLNTSTTGWTDFHYGVALSALGSVAGVTPRVECHVVYINSAGLIAA